MGQWKNTWQPEIYEPKGSYISGYTQPSYGVLAIDIDEKCLEEMLVGNISVALVKAIREGEDNSAVMSVVKYH